MSLDRAARLPIRTALSGPAAGVEGAIDVARQAGRPNTLTFDMGGTSTDVCLIRNYEGGLGFERDVAGFPIRLPMVNVHTVGAGGGSVAWFDKDDLLKVGPVSAGAAPGPACYGLGGERFTVTDANLLLGRLSPAGLAGGTMALDVRLAEGAARAVASPLNVSTRRAALGVVEIVVANMVRAIRAVSVEKGHDPREYALMPFGGAGPVHACEIARALCIRDIIVPPAPGILCAQGLIVSDLKEDFVATVRAPLSEAHAPGIQAALAALAASAQAWFREEGVPAERRRQAFVFDLRYVGQNHELAVAAPPGLRHAISADQIAELRSLFLETHRRRYGHCDETGSVELVNVRLTAQGRLYTPPPSPAHAAGVAPRASGARLVCFSDETPLQTPVYQREALATGVEIVGPAVIEQLDSTTLLFPADRLTAHASGALLIKVHP
jgi:N-methylhydantoinase A